MLLNVFNFIDKKNASLKRKKVELVNVLVLFSFPKLFWQQNVESSIV
jgi:hypothetical protein